MKDMQEDLTSTDYSLDVTTISGQGYRDYTEAIFHKKQQY